MANARAAKGEFWFLEYQGKLTVGQCYSAGTMCNLWEVSGRDILVDSTRDGFRELKKIDPPVMGKTAHQIHNETAGDIVKRIIGPTLEAGGQMTDVMVLLESIMVGVMLVGVRLGGDELILDRMVDGVRGRMAEIRLAVPAGHA